MHADTHTRTLVQVDQALLEQIPGQLNNRKTIMGELNWIFTAITDTIAWNILPPDIFQRLFRQVCVCVRARACVRASVRP